MKFLTNNRLTICIVLLVLIVVIILLLKIKFNKNKINEGMYSKKPDFIPSSKFTGSKKGYVFKKCKKGLGYYIDIKPVIEI
jgi:hypothetical protein